MRPRSVLLVLAAVALVPSAAFGAPPPVASAPKAVAKPAQPVAVPKAAAPPSRGAALPTTIALGTRKPPASPRTASTKTVTTAREAPPVSTAEMGEASAWVKRLAPSPGFAYGFDAYQRLSEPAKAVLGSFGKIRNYVLRIAGEHGVGDVVTEHTVEIDPNEIMADLDQELAKAGPQGRASPYTSADAATILRNAAKRPGTDSLMKKALLQAADTWESRIDEGAWVTALKMKPKPPAAVARPQGSGAYEQQLRARADGEWSRGRQAIGWGPEWREFDIQYELHPHAQSNIRAFTYDMWMRFRTAKLREQDEQRAYTDLFSGPARHRF